MCIPLDDCLLYKYTEHRCILEMVQNDVTGMIELIIKCHTTSGKASSYADKRRAEE